MKLARIRLVVLIAGACLAAASRDVGAASAQGAPPPAPTFVNSVYEGADPFVYQHTDGYYYFSQSEGDGGIAVWKSKRLTDKGIKRVVWTAPTNGWNSKEVWAPEIHYLNGKWYLYYAADSGQNKDHRSGVLESVTQDAQGEYIDRGMLYTGDDIEGLTNNRWAIDATPFESGGKLYLIWSGWEAEADEQWLYIAEMANPWTVKSNRVRIADNDDHLWERVSESAGQRGLNEGPQILRRDGWVHVIYSASGSWQPTYKLGRLSIRDGLDPMIASNWRKHPEPVFQGNARVHGVGHASFPRSPDGAEEWIVYHSKIDTRPGWRRNVRVQPFGWNPDGTPRFGDAVPEGVPLPLPAGEELPRPGGSFSDEFQDERWDDWVYYGYNRGISIQGQALSLDAAEGPGMANHFSSGEKALIRGYYWDDLELSAQVRVARGEEAGLLFRATHPGVGRDAVRGYYAALLPGADLVVLRRLDGPGLTEIARSPVPLEHGLSYRLTVRAEGPRIEVLVDGARAIRAETGGYATGFAGVRAVEAHALFDDVRVTRR